MKTTVYKLDDKRYVDTDFINSSSGKLPQSELKHMGFGEFYIQTPDGSVQFARRSFKIEGMSGRCHLIYDDRGGSLVEALIKAMDCEIKDVTGIEPLDSY